MWSFTDMKTNNQEISFLVWYEYICVCVANFFTFILLILWHKMYWLY